MPFASESRSRAVTKTLSQTAREHGWGSASASCEAWESCRVVPVIFTVARCSPERSLPSLSRHEAPSRRLKSQRVSRRRIEEMCEGRAREARRARARRRRCRSRLASARVGEAAARDGDAQIGGDRDVICRRSRGARRARSSYVSARRGGRRRRSARRINRDAPRCEQPRLHHFALDQRLFIAEVIDGQSSPLIASSTQPFATSLLPRDAHTR